MLRYVILAGITADSICFHELKSKAFLEGIGIEEVCSYDVGAKMFARPWEANIAADYPARAMPKLKYIYTIEIRSESRR